MADAPDSKSGGVHPREGSSPSSGTNKIRHLHGAPIIPSSALSVNCPSIVRIFIDLLPFLAAQPQLFWAGPLNTLEDSLLLLSNHVHPRSGSADTSKRSCARLFSLLLARVLLRELDFEPHTFADHAVLRLLAQEL